jgi:hypothetical protein
VIKPDGRHDWGEIVFHGFAVGAPIWLVAFAFGASSREAAYVAAISFVTFFLGYHYGHGDVPRPK